MNSDLEPIEKHSWWNALPVWAWSLIGAHTMVLVAILMAFPSNLPFVDDWRWIEPLQLGNLTVGRWLFTLEEHSVFLTKVLLVLDQRLLGFNFEVFNYLSVALIAASSVLVTRTLLRNGYPPLFVSACLFLVFSGRQFPSISQMCNISWFLALFLIVLFWANLKDDRTTPSPWALTALILGPHALGLGLVIPMYALVWSLAVPASRKTRLVYAAASILGVLLAFGLPHLLSAPAITPAVTGGSYSVWTKVVPFLRCYLGLLGASYVPWHISYTSTAIWIGFLQLILVAFLATQKKDASAAEAALDFIESNPLLLMGVIFPAMVAFMRPYPSTAVEARYTTGTLVFQLGFWVFVYRRLISDLARRTCILLFFCLAAFAFGTGLLSPKVGIDWQARRSLKAEAIVSCFRESPITPERFDRCVGLAYEILFYGGDWYDYSRFDQQLRILRARRELFF
jgi:hypothetical protein